MPTERIVPVIRETMGDIDWLAEACERRRTTSAVITAAIYSYSANEDVRDGRATLSVWLIRRHP